MSEEAAGNESIHQEHALAGPARAITLDPRHPLLLNHRDQVLEVGAGHIDVFAVEAVGTIGMRHHLFRLEQGAIILDLHTACETSGGGLQIIAIGGAGATINTMPRSGITSLDAVSGWIACLAGIADHPARFYGIPELTAGERKQMRPGDSCRGPMRGLVWTRVETGTARLLDVDQAWPEGHAIPLGFGLWLAAREPGCVLAADTELPAPPLLWPALDRLHVAVIAHLRRTLGLLQRQQQQGLTRRAELIQAQTIDALERLSAVVSKTSDRAQFDLDASDPLLSSCRIVADALGTSIAHSGRSRSSGGTLGEVLEIARANRLRARPVQLHDQWWKADAGPLLAWHGKSRDPVALVRGRNRYTMLDPKHGRRHRIDRSVAKDLAPEAVSFYKVLPARALGYRDLLSFSTGGLAGSMVRIALAIIAIGLLSLIPPLLTNFLVSSVIPRTELDQLIICAAALAVTAVAIAGLQGMQGLVTLSIEGSLDYKLQAALVDRLLRLPASLFRDYTTGDLVDRSMGIEAARQILTGRVLRGFTAALFGLFSIGLMLYYDLKLGSIALVLAALRAAVTLAAGSIRVY
ncbi:ABC transporter transmembrane domain-containing protein, partial [Bradyrhizobium sp.]|uniref:ABC transporter transmembrane domain-containing protein n=1 Tax=Bradyrhizobium sp. TaxID=376 RepID=UPI003C3D7D1C